MGHKGRPRKSGKRNKSGRLLVSTEPKIIPPSDWTRERFSVYGSDGSDAIGRAYQMGLLGEDGQDLRNLARKIHRAYWPMFSVGREKSCLGLDINGQAVNDNLLDPEERERKIARERRVTETTRAVTRMGAHHRRAFDGLCIDINPDCGPAWLDGLIWAKRHAKPADPAHLQALRYAVEALNAVGNIW